MIAYLCEHCHRMMGVEDEHLGKAVKCGHCGNSQIVEDDHDELSALAVAAEQTGPYRPDNSIEIERTESAKRRTESWQFLLHGTPQPKMICPHCQTLGKMRTKSVTRNRGVHGGKVAAAVLTGGVSLLVTGLSSHERVTRAHCENCGASWDF